MITEFYSNPNKPAPTVYQLGFAQTEIDRAKQRNLTVTEYRSRVEKVGAAFRRCPYFVRDRVWPSILKEAKLYGECVVMGITRHYDDYGTVDWCDNPYILAIAPVDNPSEVVMCNLEWVQRDKPKGLDDAA